MHATKLILLLKFFTQIFETWAELNWINNHKVSFLIPHKKVNYNIYIHTYISEQLRFEYSQLCHISDFHN